MERLLLNIDKKTFRPPILCLSLVSRYLLLKHMSAVVEKLPQWILNLIIVQRLDMFSMVVAPKAARTEFLNQLKGQEHSLHAKIELH